MMQLSVLDQRADCARITPDAVRNGPAAPADGRFRPRSYGRCHRAAGWTPAEAASLVRPGGRGPGSDRRSRRRRRRSRRRFSEDNQSACQHQEWATNGVASGAAARIGRSRSAVAWPRPPRSGRAAAMRRHDWFGRAAGSDAGQRSEKAAPLAETSERQGRYLRPGKLEDGDFMLAALARQDRFARGVA